MICLQVNWLSLTPKFVIKTIQFIFHFSYCTFLFSSFHLKNNFSFSAEITICSVNTNIFSLLVLEHIYNGCFLSLCLLIWTYGFSWRWFVIDVFFLEYDHIFLFLRGSSDFFIRYYTLCICCQDSGFCYVPLKTDLCPSRQLIWLVSVLKFCFTWHQQLMKSLLRPFSFQVLFSHCNPWGHPMYT